MEQILHTSVQIVSKSTSNEIDRLANSQSKYCSRIRLWPQSQVVLGGEGLETADHGSLIYYVTCGSPIRPIIENALMQNLI